MKVGGGLNYVTGPMGAGKSLFGTRRIVGALCAGQYAVTNVALLPGWEERVARHVAPLSGSGKRAKVAAAIAGRYVFERDLEEAMRYRVPGHGEARAVFVWDETHNDLNNRDWRRDGRDTILRWATQLRKLGFVGFLLSQHAGNTDAALRRVCNFEVRLQNQREQQRVLGMRVRFLPPLFLAAWYPAHLIGGGKVEPYKVERFLLSWHRKLYDTWGLYHGLDDDEEDGAASPIYLPSEGRAPAARQREEPATLGLAGSALFYRPVVCSRGCHQLPVLARFDPHTGAPLVRPAPAPELGEEAAYAAVSPARDTFRPHLLYGFRGPGVSPVSD